MNANRLVFGLLLAASAAGCADLEVTNPNQRTTDTFWSDRNDAIQGVNAAYNGLQLRGTYQRWLPFAYDTRSDIGLSRSPWPELSQFNKFTLGGYDFEVNLEIYGHHYQAIFRANQVIANVPGIQMEEGLRNRIVGEAKFIRGLAYYNLAILYGSVPLITEPSQADLRPASASNAELWAQIEKDFGDARGVLPASYTGADVGRATRGAATAMLGKAHLQQREWALASQMFAEVVASNRYQLVPSYGDNFTVGGDNNAESIFEVQFGGPAQLAAGTVGQNVARMTGPCDFPGSGFCDAQPTSWLASQYSERTVAGATDPRKDATLFYNRPGRDLYGASFAERYPNGNRGIPLDSLFYWKKYTEYYLQAQDWDDEINIKVVRLGGLLLLHAEALVEQNRTAEAAGFVNQVRARAGLAPLPAGLGQAEMRQRVATEQVRELAYEMERWKYLARHNLLGSAETASHDPTEFRFFVAGKSELLPIPTSETSRNPNVRQNPGY
jgi:hypothetical protein